jgi:hypothetical protein
MAVLLERRQLENLPLSPIGKKGGLCVQDGQDGAKIVNVHIFERRSRPPSRGRRRKRTRSISSVVRGVTVVERSGSRVRARRSVCAERCSAVTSRVSPRTGSTHRVERRRFADEGRRFLAVSSDAKERGSSECPRATRWVVAGRTASVTGRHAPSRG